MPKKIKNVFDKYTEYEKMYKAYILARKGKRYRREVILFSLRAEDNIVQMVEDIKNKCYKFSGYKLFYVYEPKKRKILAAKFKDRIIHTWYVKSFIEPIFVPQFINNSYACIKNRGMHKCALDVKRTLYNLSCKEEYKDAYILKMDIAKFFQNIDREILYNLIAKKISDPCVLNLTRQILSSTSGFDEVSGVSIPIGNYSSQLYANIYLHEIDMFCKHILKCKYYFRYADDTCIILKSKNEAKYVLQEISKFLAEHLRLKLNSKTNIFKLKQGVNFCGYKIGIGYMRLRDKGKRKLVEKLKYIEYSMRNGLMDTKAAKIKLAGHIGYIKCADIKSIEKKYFYNDE